MLPSVRVGNARIASFLQFQLRDVCAICQPSGEMSAKPLPADFRDWMMARTFEIGAEIVSRPDSPQFAKLGAACRDCITLRRDKEPFAGSVALRLVRLHLLSLIRRYLQSGIMEGGF